MTGNDLKPLLDAARAKRRADRLSKVPVAQAMHVEVTTSALDVFDRLNGGDGIVVDEALARESPCIAYEVGKRRLVFSKGIVGALDESQQALYCADTEARELSPRQRERLTAMRDAAESCHDQLKEVPKGERLTPFLTCVQAELKKRQQELQPTN